MQLPQGVSIVSVTETPYLKANNQSGTRTTYRYTVGEYGPFSFSLTDAENTPATVQAKIQDRINSLTSLGLKVS